MQSSKQAIADSSTKLLKEETTISLDNSRPGRSGLDELVPSRYALKVGEIDVMVVSDGVLSLPGAMLGHNVDPAVRGAWQSRRCGPTLRHNVDSARPPGRQGRRCGPTLRPVAIALRR